MRLLAVVVAGLVLAMPSAALPPGRSTIRLTEIPGTTSKPRDTSEIGAITIFTSLLYNKNLRPGALGSSILICTFVGSGGLRGPGVSWCQGSYTLPRGTILAIGTMRTRVFYQLVIVGGTGLYADVQGTLIGSAIGRHRNQLIFALLSS